MEDSSEFKVEETPNLEGVDQIKETIVEVVDSSNDVQDDGRFDNSISIKEEESVDEGMKMVDLDKPPEIIDVSESGGYPVVQDTSLNERIEEASVENSVIFYATPGDNMNIESESLVETENVTEEIQESSIASSSYENDSAAGIDSDAKELASLTSVDNENLGIEQIVVSKETEGLSEQLLIDGIKASPTATDILETGLEVSNLIHTNDKGEIPPVEADLGAQETEETKLQVLDANKKELSGPFYIELEGNVDRALEATRANAPAVDSSNDDGNKAKTAEMAENKVDAVVFERKPCWASLLGCCGLSEAFHLSGR